MQTNEEILASDGAIRIKTIPRIRLLLPVRYGNADNS